MSVVEKMGKNKFVKSSFTITFNIFFCMGLFHPPYKTPMMR